MQFKDTYVCLCSQLNFDGKFMSFERWNLKPEQDKAAYLFVNFYDQVQYAWYKAGFSYVDECEAVSIALQYLNKNVAKISKNRKRYTKSYIGQVCFNCIRSLHWKKCDIERNQRETSLVFEHEGKECDVLPLLPSEECLEYESPEFENGCDNIYDYIAQLGIEYDKLAHCLANPQMSLRRCKSNNSNRDVNPFADVSISSKHVDDMTDDIKNIVVKYITEFRPDLCNYIA